MTVDEAKQVLVIAALARGSDLDYHQRLVDTIGQDWRDQIGAAYNELMRYTECEYYVSRLSPSLHEAAAAMLVRVEQFEARTAPHDFRRSKASAPDEGAR